MLLSHRTTSSLAAVRGSTRCVRSFTTAASRSSRRQQLQQQLVAKAAEEEEQVAAEAETETVQEETIVADDFEFSLSDAKKVRWHRQGALLCVIVRCATAAKKLC